MRKNTFLSLLAILLTFSVSAQLSITSTGVAQVIDFDNTIADVNIGQYDGSGFTSSPAAGQLDSDAWEMMGMSTGSISFGGTGTSGDFARGTSTGGVSGGGCYAFDVLGTSASYAIGFQPGGSDFTPGSLTLKVTNNTGTSVNEVVLSYDLFINNDHPRANTFDGSYSTDNTTFTSVTALEETSTEVLDALGFVNHPKTATITVSLNAGDHFYIRWDSDDDQGTGSRDEFALDNISVTMNSSSVSIPPSVSITTTSNTTCPSSTDGLLTATTTGGTTNYDYDWSNGSSTTNTSATTNTINSLSAGTYTVTVTDNAGLTATASATIVSGTDNTDPIITVCAITSNITANASCQGTAPNLTGSVTATDNCTATPTITQSPASGATLGLGTTTITLTATDGSGNTATCTVNQTVIDALPPIITACASTPSNIIANASCQGSAPNLTGSVIATDNCSGTPTITQIPTSGTILGLGTTTITLTATDASGNTAICTVNQTVIDATAPTITVCASTPPALPANGSNQALAVDLTGGVTATDNCSSSPIITQSPASGATLGLGTTTITLTAMDGSGNTATCTVNQTVVGAFGASITGQTNVACNGSSTGAITSTAVGGTAPYTFQWNNGATTNNISGLSATTYTLTITDNSGLTATASTIITEPTALIATAVTDSNISCNGFTDGGASVNTSGGSSPYTYLWSNGATTNSITGISFGTYSVTLTDNYGCTNTSSAIITEPTTMVAAAVVDSNASCNGFSDGGATASATGGTSPYTYSWANSATTASITGIAAGSYSLYITDANGCSSGTSVSITEPATLQAASVVDSNVTCTGYNNGGATASATGGTAPYSYTWSNTATTASITGVPAGTYTATITDASGCSSSSSLTITEPITLVATAVVDSNISCNGISDGGTSVSVINGTAPYTYAWSNSSSNTSISGLVAGTYSVTVTDNSGCTSSSSATVSEPTALVALTVLDSNISCNGLANGGATASASTGTAPYTYLWSNGATTASITNLAAGMYTVTLTDANGCTATNNSTFTEPTLIVATTVADSTVSCNGMADGAATVSVTGGTAPYTYLWSDGNVTASVASLVADTHIITITDNSGCSVVDSVVISEPSPLISALAITNNESCPNTADGTAFVTPTGGTAPYTYSWNNGDTTNAVAGLTAGTYSVTVTDANGCTDASSISLISGLVTTDTVTTTSCTNYTSPSGNYLWTTSGTYMDTIPNAAGCDSIMTINLTILNATIAVRDVTACDSLVSLDGTTTYTVSGTYIDVIQNSVGCDSVITTNLTITHPTTATVNVSSCESFIGPSGTQIWYTSGTYTDVIPNSGGCDSTITFILTINQPTSFIQNLTICKGEEVTVGNNVYSVAGNYVDTIPNSNMCDSVVTTNITVEEVSVLVTQKGSRLTADNSNGTYQWINCDSNNAPIAGQTNQSFVATANGNYAVIVTEGSCSDTSDCISITSVGIANITNEMAIKVYPNPAGVNQSNITVEVTNASNYSLTIRDITGKTMYIKENLSTSSNPIDISNFAKGTFFIEIKTENYTSFKKLIVL